MESSFQDIRITGLDTNKSHDLPSQDGTHRIHLTLSDVPPTWRDIFERERRTRVVQYGAMQLLTVCLLSLRVPQRNLKNIIWTS
jgi:hypothetical protein